MLKKISVKQLKLGMHLKEFCGSWMEHPFWRETFLLKRSEDLHLIRQSGISEVWIDVSKGLDVDAGVTEQEIEAVVEQVLQQAAGRPELPRQVPAAEEMHRAAMICEKARGAVVSMFTEVRMGNAVNAESANHVVEEIYSSVLRNPGALISLARLKTVDDYTYMHSVAVCALMVSLGRRLGLDSAMTREAGLAGLLHDLGKAMTPNHILNKPGKLTDEEFAIIKEHPVLGHRALLDSRSVGDIALDVCLHHHEKVDGSGYPHRLKSDEISLFAKMGAVCDVYDAITSTRPYKSGWHPAEAVRKMAEWSKGHFEERVFQGFVKSIGIYPVGSLVRLSSGRLGVVIEQTERSLLAPIVKVFFSTKSKGYIRPELVDLANPVCQETITGYEQAAKWDIEKLDEVWATTQH